MAEINFLGALLVTAICVLASCQRPQTLAEQCASRYPRPSDSATAADTTTLPALHSLPLFQPSDSLPQIYTADSSRGWFRNLFFADFTRFRGEREIHSFRARFAARIVGKDSAGWYAVMIPDPGPDTALFTLLRYCIGATYGVYVRSEYSRAPAFLLQQ